MARGLNEKLESLSWNCDAILQEETVSYFVENIGDQIGILIQPLGKDCWENAALILSKIGTPRVNTNIPELIEWLKDMNWPGAVTVLQLLSTVDDEVLKPHIRHSLESALLDDDIIWFEAIKQLQ